MLGRIVNILEVEMAEQLPLCKCGCGERVTKKGNRFIFNHHGKGKHPSEETLKKRSKAIKEAFKNPKLIPEAKLCECGCREYALPWNDYIWGHNNNGKSEKTRLKMSEAAKNRVYSEADRLRMSEISLREKEPLPDGQKPNYGEITTNKECGVYLGCYIAERVLSKVFKNVKMMPIGNHGYDIICSNDKRIDIKSSATGRKGYWQFNILQNEIADYFLCIAFEDRNDLTPIHLWLIPGEDINHLKYIVISKSNLQEWVKYEQPIDKVIKCCNEMRN